MSTARRFEWLKALSALILIFGLIGPAVAAEDDDSTQMGLVEQLFWWCEGENLIRFSENAVQCCDADACYTCLRDFSECFISNNSRTGSIEVAPIESFGQNLSEMQERPTEGQLEAVCTSVKANFNSLKGFGYSCMKPNCNGKGDYCTIICHGGRRCTAGTPDAIKGPVSLRGILQNGDNIDRSKSPSGSEGGGKDAKQEDSTPCGPDGCLY